ncbi:MAG: hypothetical protein GEU78_18400, partial [Actinobacteria bacterium]|nr:hypothetical protein [Actinomycetota bacterium]
MGHPEKRAAYPPEILNSSRRLEPAGKVRLMLRVVHDINEHVDATADEQPVIEAGPGLDELCRLAAREMIAVALEAERRAYLDAHAGHVDATGRRLVVGNGYANERAITTAAGGVEVRAPRVDDRSEGGQFV